MQDLAAPYVHVSLLIPLSNKYGSRYTGQAGDLYDVLQFKMLDFPGKPSDLLFSHTLWQLARKKSRQSRRDNLNAGLEIQLSFKASQITCAEAAFDFWLHYLFLCFEL
jgi:hypothetical protein